MPNVGVGAAPRSRQVPAQGPVRPTGWGDLQRFANGMIVEDVLVDDGCVHGKHFHSQGIVAQEFPSLLVEKARDATMALEREYLLIEGDSHLDILGAQTLGQLAH